MKNLRFKRNSEPVLVENNEQQQQQQLSPRPRKLMRKLIRRITNSSSNSQRNLNNDNNNDKFSEFNINRNNKNNYNNQNLSGTTNEVNIKRSIANNRSDNENTQIEIKKKMNVAADDVIIKPSKRRIIVPIRRTRVHPTSKFTPLEETTPEPITESISTTTKLTPIPLNNRNGIANVRTEQKRKLFVKRRRITKPSVASISVPVAPVQQLQQIKETLTDHRQNEQLDDVIEKTTVETVTNLSTRQRTYTYVVTRVHDKQTEVISSTMVRDQIQSITDTITRTIYETIKPTAVIKPSTALSIQSTIQLF